MSPGPSTCVKKPVWTKPIVWRWLVRPPCTAAKSHRGHRATSMSICKLLELTGLIGGDNDFAEIPNLINAY